MSQLPKKTTKISNGPAVLMRYCTLKVGDDTHTRGTLARSNTTMSNSFAWSATVDGISNAKSFTNEVTCRNCKSIPTIPESNKDTENDFGTGAPPRRYVM
eukprot:6207592-Amphidinium_carterae.1